MLAVLIARSKERVKKEKHVKHQLVLSECSEYVKFMGQRAINITQDQALQEEPENNYKPFSTIYHTEQPLG